MVMRWLYKLFGVFNIPDWQYSLGETNLEFNRIKANQYIYPQLDSITLRTTKILPAGWYLFCIQHSGENLRCFGSLKSGINLSSQSRPMYPERKRFRVIRIRNDSAVTLKLNFRNEHITMDF